MEATTQISIDDNNIESEVVMEEIDVLKDDEDLFEPDIEENNQEADEVETGTEERPKVMVNISYIAKLKEIFRNLSSVEIQICTDASKEFIKLLRGESGGEILCQYVQDSPSLSELKEAWQVRQGKPVVARILSLIAVVLDHPEGRYKSGSGRLNISRGLDAFASSIIKNKLQDVYTELSSKEGKRQNAALSLMAAIVRRGVGLASEVAKNFDFKLPAFPKLSEYLKNKVIKKGKHSTRRSFIEFAVSFLEVGDPRLLRWILQQRDMFSGILRGLGSDDDETIFHVLSALRDKVLTPHSLVPPSLRSVLFGSVTLEQLAGISGSPTGGPSADIAHEVLLLACTDPQNGLMPDLKAQPYPLKGNSKRLTDFLQKLKPIDSSHHRDLLLSIVHGRPSFCSVYLDEFPYILEPRASANWFSAVSLAADLVSFASTSFSFDFLASQIHDPPTIDSPEVQCMLKCIIPSAFTRLVINRGLQHSNLLVKHGSLRLLLEALKSLNNYISAIGCSAHANNSMIYKLLSLKQDFQDEVRALLPDPQLLYKLLPKEKDKKPVGNICGVKSKRARSSEGSPQLQLQGSAKKQKTECSDDIDILICGISTESNDVLSKESENVHDKLITEEEVESVKAIAGIWGLQESATIGNELKDAEMYFQSKVLDVLALYLRTMPIALEGSYNLFNELPDDPTTLSVNHQQSLLSLLIEYIGWSPGKKGLIEPPGLIYKHLKPLLSLLIRSPVKGIREQAYTLSKAAMLSTGAFDRNPSEIDAWFLFLPGYTQEEVPEDAVKVFGDLFRVVVSFLYDAVSNVGKNLYKYHDHVRRIISKLKSDIDVSPDFSPLIFCVLDKCLRLLDSKSEKKLCDKSMISIYVCNTLSFILQTQVQVGLLPAFMDSILTERLGNFSAAGDESDEFLCERRALKNLSIFSRNLSHQQACSSFFSIAPRTLSPRQHPFVKTLSKIEKVLKSKRGESLVGVAATFSSSVVCITPNEILENFPRIITMSQHLLRQHIPFLSSLFFLERNLLAGVIDTWPDIFFSGLELVNGRINPGSRNNSHSSEEFMELNSTESAPVAFSFFLKQTPFFVLFSSIIGLGNSYLLASTKLIDILKVKLCESSPKDSIVSLRLILFWVHQLQLSYRVKPSDEVDALIETCFVFIKQIFTKVLVMKSTSDTSTTIEAPDLVVYAQEVAKVIIHHPAVILSLSHPFFYNTEPPGGSLSHTFEEFLCSSKLSFHVDLNVIHLLTTMADYLLALCNDQCDDAGNIKLLKVFRTMVQQVVLLFRDKFDFYIESKDMMPLLPTYITLRALIRYTSPLELIELVNWVFHKVDQTDWIGCTSSKLDAFSIGCSIAGDTFDLLSSYFQHIKERKISSSLFWKFDEEKFDIVLLEQVYHKLIELAISVKLECADLCLLKAVTSVYRHKTTQLQTDVLPPIMAMSRVIISTPTKILSHCIHQPSSTKARFLFLLTEVSPLHITLFGQIFSSIMEKCLPLQKNTSEENCIHVLSDKELMMLLPVALSYLNYNINKYGIQCLNCMGTILSVYSTVLLDGFLNRTFFVSENLFKVEYGELVPSSTEDLFNLFNGSLSGKAIQMLRYYFASVGSVELKKKKLFGAIYPLSSHDELLDCDDNGINTWSIEHSLNIMCKVMTKISFIRLLLFPEVDVIHYLKTQKSGDLKEMPLRIGSKRNHSLELRFMSILVGTLHKIVERLLLVADNSDKSNRADCSPWFRFLEGFILTNIIQLTKEMEKQLVQLDSIPFLKPFVKSCLLHRFEDPKTLKALRCVLVSLSEGKMSFNVFLEMLQSHSQFVPSILWSDSMSDSSSVSHGGTLLRPMSSDSKSHVSVATDLRAFDGKTCLEISPLCSRKLELLKLFRVLYHLQGRKNSIAPAEDKIKNSRELLSLLLSCYGATMSEIDLEIFCLMQETGSIEGSDFLGIAKMDYLWGSAALKLRTEKDIDSANDINDSETCEKRRRQFRENFAIDQKLCLALVSHFPYDRVACDGHTSLDKLQKDDLVDMLEEAPPRIDRIQRYDPAFLLRFSIHGLSMGYFENLEFAELGLLAITIMSISSPDEGMRKLAYDALARFYKMLPEYRNKKVRLLFQSFMTYLQNGIREEFQKIPSAIAVFMAEASFILLDPSHDHYSTIKELLVHSVGVNLERIPLFDTLVDSSSKNFKKDRLWILGLSYVGLNSNDDAQVFKSKCVKLLSFYSSPLSDNESKTLILQIVKKSVKLQPLACYLVERCGLISWLSSVIGFCRGELCGEDKTLFLKQMTVVLEVVNDVISERAISEKCSIEQLSEFSSHIYKYLFGSFETLKQNVYLVRLILQIVVTTLRISQRREIIQPHFRISYESLFQLSQVIDQEPDKTQYNLVAKLVLSAMLTSSPPILETHLLQDRENLVRFVKWGISVASTTHPKETSVPEQSNIQFEQPDHKTLISTLLRWLVASVILERVYRKSRKIKSCSSEIRNAENLQLFLDYVKKEKLIAREDDYVEDEENVCSNGIPLAAIILYLQQFLGIECKILPSVISALCILLLSDGNNNTGAAVPLSDDQVRHVESMCSKICCPVEAHPAWRWSFDQPWEDSEDLTSELTDNQKVDEYNACQTLLVIFSNALRGNSLDLPVLSHRDLEESDVFAWEKTFLDLN